MRRALVLTVVLLGVAVAAVLAMQLPYFSAPASDPAALQTGEGAPETARGEVTLDTRRQQLIGVQTVEVQHETLSPEIRAAGSVRYDETRLAEINTRVDGWIRELYADYTGRVIRKGEPLFTLYSPELIASQTEYLLALRGHGSESGDPKLQQYADRLIEAARDRLLRLDMTPEEIERLRQTGQPTETTTFRSPVSGVVVEKLAVRGVHVTPGEPLFRVADLSTVWVEADVYERELANVHVGTAAEVTVPAYPDRPFTGRVSYISQEVEPQTRTVRTRVVLSNPGGMLKPNMLATVVLKVRSTEALVVPADAVVDTGTERLVFVAEGEGRFTPRAVQVGRRADDKVEIVSGLAHGDIVAASGTFFLDSESQLRGALGAYAPPVPARGAETAAGGDAASSPEYTVSFRTDPDPPRLDGLSLLVTVKDTNGQPVSDAEVSLVLFMPPMPSMNMPAMKDRVALAHVEGGLYRASGQLLMTGRWDVTVTVTRHGQPLTTRHFSMVAR